MHRSLNFKISPFALAIRLAVTLILSSFALAGYTPLANKPPHYVGFQMLLTDGTVIAQEVHSNGLGTGIWYRLTPDINGSYINGTWTQIATMPGTYAPDFYASAVLPDGRVIVEGGEYNGNNGTQVETNLGAIYDPSTNTWTSVTPPVGWSQIGDASSVVLPNGTFMLGNCCSSSQALLNASNLTWSIVGNGKADSNSEEGWTLLPNGKVLTVDIWDTRNTELFDPNSQTWSSAGSTPSSLVNLCETGPGVLRPDGTVLALGASGTTAIYNSSTGTWTAGTPLPTGYVSSDAPAALLPSGNVLVGVGGPVTGSCTSPSESQRIYFYEFNGSSFSFVAGPVGDFPYEGRLLVLPNGGVLWTHNSDDVQIYTGSGTYQSSWQPTISSYPANVNPATAGYSIFGTQFNGLSQGAMFGDDYQSATNYPLVRIKNNSTGHIFYCKTHNHSTMGVATGSASVSTEFDVPANIETGASTLVVVANGIPSNPVNITVNGPLCTASTSCSVVGMAPYQQVAGGVTVSCTQSMALSASATICGNGCTTNSNSVPSGTSIGAGGAQPGSGGSCSLSWSWGGNQYNQNINVP